MKSRMRKSRKAAMETLTAQNAQMAKAFETEGTAIAPTPDSPDGKLNKLAEDRVTKMAGKETKRTSLREGHGDPAGSRNFTPSRFSKEGIQRWRHTKV